MSLADRLRRRTVSEKYIPGIDGLRFAAILSVVCLHILNQDGRWLFSPGPAVHHGWLLDFCLRLAGNGARGVPIFFAISGFILALPFARHRFHNERPISLSFYLLRRVTRLEPPYILTLLLRLVLLSLLMPRAGGHYLQHFLASAAYLHNLVYGIPSIINIPAWSLEIEIQFYCLVPLLAYYFAWREPLHRRAALLCVMAGCGAVQLLYLQTSPRAMLSILFWLQYFLAGFLVADLYLTDWPRIPRHWLWEVFTLPLWLWMFYDLRPGFHAVMPFLLIAVFLAAFKAPLQRRFFSNAYIAVIGGMCYSLYLIHSLVLTGVDRLLGKLPFTPPVVFVWFCCLGAVLLVGATFYLLVERPCMDPNWPKRLWRRMFPAAAATTDPAV